MNTQYLHDMWTGMGQEVVWSSPDPVIEHFAF